MEDNSKSSRVPALERGLDVLELLAKRDAAATLTQIARELGLTPSEVQRPVACLLQRGYLHRNAEQAYQLGALFHRLAQAHPPHRNLLAAANPAMADFARATGESVHIAVESEGKALLLAQAQGTGLVRISLQMGVSLELKATVSGRILLAFGGVQGGGRIAEADPELERRLVSIRARGHEFAASTYAEGVEDLGVPVYAAGGTRAIAALTLCSIQLKRGQRKLVDLLPALQTCAGEIGLAYGPDADAGAPA